MGILINVNKPLPMHLIRMLQRKLKFLRGIHKLRLNKKLRKAMMERSRLKNKSNKSKQLADIPSRHATFRGRPLKVL